MRTVGVIAEYDPLHRGHEYHLAKLREAGAEAIVVALGGDLTQRGQTAFCEKGLRAAAALEAGADLVLELPLPFAMASAERFARGGVELLDGLGVADTLAFGSESGDSGRIEELAELLDTEEFSAVLRQELDSGSGYAAARARAAGRLKPSLGALLEGPNDLLAAEYCKWLRRRGSVMRPFAVKRRGAGHGGPAGEGFASAGFLRRFSDAEALRPYVPESVFPLYEEAQRRGELPCRWDRLETAVLARLRAMKEEDFERVPDAGTEGLWHRVYDSSRRAGSLEELYGLIKTRRYAMTRVRRVVAGAFLGLDETVLKAAPVPFIRVLAMNSRGEAVLRQTKGRAALPVSSSLSELERLSERAAYFAGLQALEADLFWLTASAPRPCGEAYRRKLIRPRG